MKITKTRKKIVIVVTALLIAVVVALAFKFFALQKEHNLIDYLPPNSELWLWQNQGGYNEHSNVVVEQLGVGQYIMGVLKDSVEELIIYRQGGEWYKLEMTSVQDRVPFEDRDELWQQLYAQGTVDLIGFLHQDYLSSQLSGFGIPWGEESVYFVVKNNGDSVNFRMMEERKVLAFRAKSGTGDFFGADCEPVLAIKFDDSEVRRKILDEARDHYIIRVAAEYPVVVSTKLPDGTFMRERVVNPDLFAWQEVGQFIYKLVLDQDKITEYDVADQMQEFESDLGYFEDDNILVIVLDYHDLESCVDVTQLADLKTLFYLNLDLDDDWTIGDILGKNNGLDWLRDRGVRSIMVYEIVEGILEGEIKF